MSHDTNSYTAKQTRPRGYAKVLFFIEGDTVPASRFRVLQFIESLRNKGVETRILSTKPNKYLSLPKWLNLPIIRQVVLALQLIFIVMQRVAQIVIWGGWGDVIVLQRDLLFRDPFGLLERFLLWRSGAGRRLVFDVDDATFLSKNGEPSEVLERKYARILPNVKLIIAGNSYLEKYFAKFAKSKVIPTVLDTEVFKRIEVRRNNPLVIGWTGVESNLHYLLAINSALEKVYKEQPFTFMIITNDGAKNPFPGASFPVEVLPWSALSEVRDLSRLDIGVMPLPESAWSEGKCGFKILQYMSLEIPSVASGIGVNNEIIKHGENGLLCRTEEQWTAALLMLLRDAQFRNEVAKAGRKRVVEQFSIEKWSNEWVVAVLGDGESVNVPLA